MSRSRLLAAGVGAVALAAGAAPAFGSGKRTLYVSPHGSGRARCTKSAPCSSIVRAVKLARRGETISVAHGTYTQDVKISKDITIVGHGNPVIDAKGKHNGFTISGSGAAGTTVKGFKVEFANFEGIFVTQTSDVTISGNTVTFSDLGGSAPNPTGECAKEGIEPGNCGEAIHLLTVTHSKLTDNVADNNSGGIYLTDELGPTANNLIEHNKANDNYYACGITLAGHSTHAVSASGTPQPTVAGIYNNRMIDNTTDNNGTKVEGAGIFLGAATPGSAVYDNLVEGNTATGNGLAGVTIHSHIYGEDLNGNQIIDNTVSNDGLIGDPDFGITGTIGIFLGSANTTLSGTEVSGNSISNVHYGIWTKNVPPISPSANTFTNVTVPVSQN